MSSVEPARLMTLPELTGYRGRSLYFRRDLIFDDDELQARRHIFYTVLEAKALSGQELCDLEPNIIETRFPVFCAGVGEISQQPDTASNAVFPALRCAGSVADCPIWPQMTFAHECSPAIGV